jgi:hypothetical protein
MDLSTPFLLGVILICDAKANRTLLIYPMLEFK